MSLTEILLLYIATTLTLMMLLGIMALTAIRYGIMWAMKELETFKKKGIGGIVGGSGGAGGGGGMLEMLGPLLGMLGGGK